MDVAESIPEWIVQLEFERYAKLVNEAREGEDTIGVTKEMIQCFVEKGWATVQYRMLGKKVMVV